MIKKPFLVKTSPEEITLELVVWLDITSVHSGWETYTVEAIEALHPDLCYTPGWVVYEDEELIKIVSGFAGQTEDWAFSFDSTIPKSLIKERTVLLKDWTY